MQDIYLLDWTGMKDIYFNVKLVYATLKVQDSVVVLPSERLDLILTGIMVVSYHKGDGGCVWDRPAPSLRQWKTKF